MSKRPLDVGAYYDDFWSGGDPEALAEHDYRAFQADLFAYVDRRLGDLSGQRVLEVGPGLGLDTLRLLRKGGEVWAIDLSGASLHLVRERCRAAGFGERVHPAQMNGEHLALPDALFDLVYMQCTLMHADWPVVVKECRRV
ncbi:MAG: class I SAM-dependent methyltransferase, partial [Chloroflexota bacterium]